VFTVFWCGFLVFWYAMAASAGSVVAMLFPLIHVAAGVFLAYLTVAGFVNTTTVRVSAGRLTVEHGPLPWPGQRDLSTDDIEQLYCQEKTVRTKNGTRTTYQLAAATRHGRDVKLVSGLAELSPARFLEYELEAHLGIADRPVVGEVPKRVG